MKRSQLRRDWTYAEDKRGPCRNCGATYRVELAHVTERTSDRYQPLRIEDGDPADWTGEKGPIYVHPDRVLPLCGPATDVTTCHGKDHAKRLDLLPLLTLPEQIQAVADAGGIELARRRLAPSEYRAERLGVGA